MKFDYKPVSCRPRQYGPHSPRSYEMLTIELVRNLKSEEQLGLTICARISLPENISYNSYLLNKYLDFDDWDRFIDWFSRFMKYFLIGENMFIFYKNKNKIFGIFSIFLVFSISNWTP